MTLPIIDVSESYKAGRHHETCCDVHIHPGVTMREDPLQSMDGV